MAADRHRLELYDHISISSSVTPNQTAEAAAAVLQAQQFHGVSPAIRAAQLAFGILCDPPPPPDSLLQYNIPEIRISIQQTVGFCACETM